MAQTEGGQTVDQMALHQLLGRNAVAARKRFHRRRVGMGFARRVAPVPTEREDQRRAGEEWAMKASIVAWSAIRAISRWNRLGSQRAGPAFPSRGAVGGQPSVREAFEVFEARAKVEPRAAHTADEGSTVEDINALRAALRQAVAADCIRSCRHQHAVPLAKVGETGDGGSVHDRKDAAACWNAVMDENRCRVRKRDQFIAA